MAKELSELEIQVRIMPTMARWPSPEVRKERAWDALRDAGSLLRMFVRNIDTQCRQAEQDPDLSAEGIARRRAALGHHGLGELESWPPFVKAEKLVADNIALLESKMTGLPPGPQTAVEALLAQEIRGHIKAHKHPIDHVLSSLSNPRVVAAVLHAPAFLSGLSEPEFALAHARARKALHPEQVELQEQLRKALDDLRGGVAATKRLLRERCEVPASAPMLSSKESEAVA